MSVNALADGPAAGTVGLVYEVGPDGRPAPPPPSGPLEPPPARTRPEVVVVDKERHVRAGLMRRALRDLMGPGKRYEDASAALTAWEHETGVVRGDHVPIVGTPEGKGECAP